MDTTKKAEREPANMIAVRKRCKETYGFVSEPDSPHWLNKLNALLLFHPKVYFAQIKNLAYHNLLTSLAPPPGTGLLLGLGSKFCIERGKPPTTWKKSIFRLRRSIRLKHWLKRHDTGSSDYNPKLYVKSGFNPPPIEEGPAEILMMDFASTLERINIPPPRSKFNLTAVQYRLLKIFKTDHRYHICHSDKNLGPVIMEKHVYIRRAFSDHLGNIRDYKSLSQDSATERLARARRTLTKLIERHKDTLPDSEVTYFARSLQQTVRIPIFYLTIKIHKDPWATRPVVSCVGSLMNIFSKWLDFQMKKLLPLATAYLRDSYQVLNQLRALRLPTTAKLFTADAVSMYSNINADHGLATFRRWFTMFKHEVPTDFPTTLFLRLLEAVMTTNVFQFGDTFWLQTRGTAMGTSCACLYATLYYAFRERTAILPRYSHALPYYGRFIDDILGIWIGTTDEWTAFQADLSYGDLRWITSELSNEVTFLDLTISINSEQRIETRTYQKPMNLFLYIPPCSAHPPGVLKSTIFGNLRRFWLQNTTTKDYQDATRAFAQQLVARGHNHASIKPLFLEAAQKLDQPQTQRLTDPAASNDALFYHLEYHPRGIDKTTIRGAYQRHLKKHSGFQRFIIAYARPKNLSDAIMPSTLKSDATNQASAFLPHRGPPR
jgi:hypothetical protein